MLFFILSSILTAASGFDFDWDQHVITQHTQFKLLSECLGKSFVDSWKDSVAASSIKCFSEDSLGEIPVLPSTLEEALYKNNIFGGVGGPAAPAPSDGVDIHNLLQGTTYLHPPYNIPPRHLIPLFTPQVLPPYNPSVVAFQQPLLDHLSRRFPNLNFQTLNRSPHGVWKRDAEEKTSEPISSGRSSKILKLRPEWRTEETNDVAKLLSPAHPLDPVKKQIGDRISNITCVLKSMEVLDEFGRPNYDRNLELINHLRVSDNLRDSLKASHEFCKEFSLCVPVHRASNLLVREIGQSLIFLKCLKRKVLNACVREDMRSNGVLNSFASSVFDMTTLERTHAPGARSLFADTPNDVVKNLEDFFASEDEVAFGY